MMKPRISRKIQGGQRNEQMPTPKGKAFFLLAPPASCIAIGNRS
jgi:hypothetical protein